MIYIYQNIVNELEKFILDKWPQKRVTSQCYSGMWHKYRFIKVSVSPICGDDNIYYKYSNGYVELHFAGHDYPLYRFIRNRIPSKYGEYQWHQYYNMTRGLLRIEYEVNSMNDLYTAFTTIINLVDPVIFQYQGDLSNQALFETINDNPSKADKDREVILERMSLNDVIQRKITIPEYQRIYCWPKNNVELLLDDILQNNNQGRGHSYHLGTLILQEKSDRFDVIDGQQRLVTLAMVLSFLGEHSISLLNESFNSKEAEKYIAYNKYLIHTFFEKLCYDDIQKDRLAKSMLSRLCFDVLILKDGSLDLAYTFFSSQNSKRGKPLSDYELLKSHHLRYISNENEEQQMHLASRWDELLMKSERQKGNQSVSITLGMYLFNLRKWSKMVTWDIHERNRVKNEYEAAKVIREIPPFGEKFVYYEPIQGGTHFFAYTETFTEQFNAFQNTAQFKLLWETISCSGVREWHGCRNVEGKKRTHWWFGDIIASFLFAYYLKFGASYLAEALTCITRIVSKIRYATKRANRQSLCEEAGRTRLVFMIEQASSPTFFLAEAMDVIRILPSLSEDQQQDIRGDYLRNEKRLYEENSKYYSVVDFRKAHV